MELGLVLPHTGPSATPAFMLDFARAAEAAAIDALWAVDHLVLPHHVESPYVLGRNPVRVADGWLPDQFGNNYEAVTTLTWVAAHTTSIGLGTSVTVLPIRNAIANARQFATLDALCGGRLTLGVGVGWLREEADAMGMPWSQRVARSEEHIELMRTLWCAPEALVEFHGQHYDLAPMDPRPRPLQRPIPILVGGHSDAALDRAARIGDGWIAAPMPPQRLRERLGVLHAAAARHGRDFESLRVVASTTTARSESLGRVLAPFHDIGVDHLQVLLPTDDPGRTIADIDRLADARVEAGMTAN